MGSESKTNAWPAPELQDHGGTTLLEPGCIETDIVLTKEAWVRQETPVGTDTGTAELLLQLRDLPTPTSLAFLSGRQ